MALVHRHGKPDGHGAPALTENVLRLAIHQRHDVEEAGEVVDTVAVEVPGPAGDPVRALVSVFTVRNRRGEGRCFVWAQAPDEATAIVHTVMQSPSITTAVQAVRSRIGARDL